MNNFKNQFVTWATERGDVVTVYTTAERDDKGGLKTRWHWRLTHRDGSRILARSAVAKKRRHAAVWEARRVNPDPARALADQADCVCGHPRKRHVNGFGCVVAATGAGPGRFEDDCQNYRPTVSPSPQMAR